MNEVQTSQLERIKAQALTDDGFKQKLFADPVGVLRAEGVEIPGPLAASDGELSLNQLDQVSAGDVGAIEWIHENVTGPIWNAIYTPPSPGDGKDQGTAGVRG